MNIAKVPKNELTDRMKRFTAALDKQYADWELCAIVGMMNMYYLTGTICDGVLLIKRGETPVLWVRRDYRRAVLESELSDIRPMTSFRDVAASYPSFPGTLHLDMSAATLEWFGFLNKYIPFNKTLPVDTVLLEVRAIKSQYEIDIISRAGKIFDRLLRENLPSLFKEGMSEAELGADMYSLFVKNGYHGISRFLMKNVEVILGHIGFMESPVYPSTFNGASGVIGICPAAPVLGSRDITLSKGNLIYIDIGSGIEGYNIDKTLLYSFRKPQPEYVNDIHHHCLELEKQAASMLNPGTKPSDIYKTIYESVKPELRERFMGAPGRTVPFLGHGVGLNVDELPVIAKGFDKPLECGMIIAIEPKISIEGVGLVGSENTYLVTENGAVSLTGNMQEIILC